MAALAAPQPCHKEEFELLKARLSAKPPSPPLGGLLPTNIPELDRLLDGGLPAGAVTTLEGEIGRWSLAAGLVAGATRKGLVAILDDGGLYPPALAQAGARLERVLVVPVRRAIAMARAADILLRSRICRLVLVPAMAVRDAIWTRLATLAHRSGAILIVVAARANAALSAAAGVRLHCALERAVVHGRRGLWGSIAGFELSVGVRKHRHNVVGGTVRIRAEHAEMLDAALR